MHPITTLAVAAALTMLVAACDRPADAPDAGNPAAARMQPSVNDNNAGGIGNPDPVARVAWKPCPVPLPGSPAAEPAFAVNGTRGPTYDCQQGGPLLWPALPASAREDWYLQRIEGLLPRGCANQSCAVRLVRICSKSAEHPAGQFRAGPCDSRDGVGPNGCEICMIHPPLP